MSVNFGPKTIPNPLGMVQPNLMGTSQPKLDTSARTTLGGVTYDYAGQPLAPFKDNGSVLGDTFNSYSAPDPQAAQQTAQAAADTQARNDTLSYIDEQDGMLARMLQSASTGLDNGLNQLTDSFNKEVSGANSQRSTAMRNYGIQREDTTQGQQKALGQVDTNARTLADSLRRRIGMSSGSGSSAYQIAAPGAVARDASLNRQGVQENFGRNFRDLSLAEGDAEEGYNKLIKDLGEQRSTRESGLRGGILEQQNTISGQRADLARQRAIAQGGDYNAARAASAPMQAQISERQNQLDGLFNKFRTPYNVQAVAPKQVNLRDYMVDRAQVSGGQSDPTAPFTNYLRPRPEDEERL